MNKIKWFNWWCKWCIHVWCSFINCVIFHSSLPTVCLCERLRSVYLYILFNLSHPLCKNSFPISVSLSLPVLDSLSFAVCPSLPLTHILRISLNSSLSGKFPIKLNPWESNLWEIKNLIQNLKIIICKLYIFMIFMGCEKKNYRNKILKEVKLTIKFTKNRKFI